MRALSALLLSCCLAGCTASPEWARPWPRAGEPPQATATVPAGVPETQRLLDQPRIDPLTRFLEQHAQDAATSAYQQVARERDSRCRAIGTRYAAEPPTSETLARLRAGYQYSCPEQVATFAQRVDHSTPPQYSGTPRADELPAQDPPMVPQRQINSCYLLFTIKNYQQALPACSAAAEAGDAKAQHHLASILKVNGKAEQALAWANRSAEQQYGPGQLLLAQLYQQGLGTAVDEQKALILIEDAAGRGVAAAQYQAGMAYLEGSGAPLDRSTAQRWLELAAGQDFLEAQLQLADLHLQERGAGQASARQWLRRAASLGSPVAQYRLGASYMDGLGGAPDYTEAYVWLSLALLNGESRAEARVRTLAVQLTAEQIQVARQRLEAGRAGRLP